MGPQSSLADQRDTNSNRAKYQWLLPANLVEEEYDEEEVEDGADNVVDAGNQQVPIAGDAEILVQNGRIVADDVDSVNCQRSMLLDPEYCQHSPCHLAKELDERGVHQSSPPSRYREHDAPSWSRDRPFSVYGQFDFVELGLDPLIVATVVVQFL